MWKDFLYYTKTERQGIIVLVVLILGVYAAPKLFSFFTHAEDTDCRENEKFDKEYNDFISSLRETQPHQSYRVFICRTEIFCNLYIRTKSLVLFFRESIYLSEIFWVAEFTLFIAIVQDILYHPGW